MVVERGLQRIAFGRDLAEDGLRLGDIDPPCGHVGELVLEDSRAVIELGKTGRLPCLPCIPGNGLQNCVPRGSELGIRAGECLLVPGVEGRLQGTLQAADLGFDTLWLRDVNAFCRKISEAVIPDGIVVGELIETGGVACGPPVRYQDFRWLPGLR